MLKVAIQTEVQAVITATIAQQQPQGKHGVTKLMARPVAATLNQAA